MIKKVFLKSFILLVFIASVVAAGYWKPNPARMYTLEFSQDDSSKLLDDNGQKWNEMLRAKYKAKITPLLHSKNTLLMNNEQVEASIYFEENNLDIYLVQTSEDGIFRIDNERKQVYIQGCGGISYLFHQDGNHAAMIMPLDTEHARCIPVVTAKFSGKSASWH